MAPHSSTLAWKIPWTEEPGGLQGCHDLLQGIFPTQESNQVSCVAGGFFTNWTIREAQISSSLLVNYNIEQNIWNNGFKALDNRQDSDPWENENKRDESYQCPSSPSGESSQATTHRETELLKSWCSHQLKTSQHTGQRVLRKRLPQYQAKLAPIWEVFCPKGRAASVSLDG